MDDQTDDWSRLKTTLRQKTGIEDISISLNLLQKMGSVLRENDWQITVITDTHIQLDGQRTNERVLAIIPDLVPEDEPMWGIAVDIGTTTVTLWLVDLITGDVRAQTSDYNGQIARGEDVISRIVYAGKNGGSEEMRNLVLATINRLIDLVCKRPAPGLTNLKNPGYRQGYRRRQQHHDSSDAGCARFEYPFCAFCNHSQPCPLLTGQDTGLNINPLGVVDCLPGVASYVGSDITAGVLASGMDDTSRITLFMDVGTNGEIVLVRMNGW